MGSIPTALPPSMPMPGITMKLPLQLLAKHSQTSEVYAVTRERNGWIMRKVDHGEGGNKGNKIPGGGL